MSNNEVIEIIDKINNYLYKTAYNEISFTTMLKVEKFIEDLKKEVMKS